MSDTPRTEVFKSEAMSSLAALSDNSWAKRLLASHLELERENNQLLTKLVIAETTCDELSPLIEKNNQLREALKECAEDLIKAQRNYRILYAINIGGLHNMETPYDKALSNPIVQQALKETKDNNQPNS